MTNVSFPPAPDQLFGQLFHDVQTSRIFPDSKTFVDCEPKTAPEVILAQYEVVKEQPDFDLRAFVHTYFNLPISPAIDHVSDTTLTTADHINQLWPWLTRLADEPVPYSSRLPLPFPYVVPGGRFREIFYWDSYFTMLGLQEAGRTDLIRQMLDNFAYLIDTYGHIPNGNRTYFLSRSQPPFFALMVQLLADMEGQQILTHYLPQLQKEYDFWMARLSAKQDTLTRYWDDTPLPRPEAYRQELELNKEAEQLGIPSETLYLHIRAACESGWDFSSRWFADEQTMSLIRTADISPVDLNCLLYSLEITLHKANQQAGNPTVAEQIAQTAMARQRAIQEQCWDETTGFFHDYDTVAQQRTTALTLAGVFPLFFNLATPEQAKRVHEKLKQDFLQAGGWVTTLKQTGQQWDWPNGWAPLQWIVYQGLMNYGFAETAHEGRDRWLGLNDKVFRATGKMMEKYNVVDAALTTGGGEYPNQDGFGWTNGVYLKLHQLAHQSPLENGTHLLAD